MGLQGAGVRCACSGRHARSGGRLPQTSRQNAHRPSRDARVLDGLDRGPGRQPDLLALTQGRHGRVGAELHAGRIPELLVLATDIGSSSTRTALLKHSALWIEETIVRGRYRILRSRIAPG